MIARLAPNVTVAQATAELLTILHHPSRVWSRVRLGECRVRGTPDRVCAASSAEVFNSPWWVAVEVARAIDSPGVVCDLYRHAAQGTLLLAARRASRGLQLVRRRA